MKVDPFQPDCCPPKPKDLDLITTRFEGHRCFAELECHVCHALWTAEIGPTPGSADLLATDVEDQPGWRILSLQRRLAS